MINYWYFFLFFIITIAFSIGFLLFVALIRFKRNVHDDKTFPYECGVDPVTPTARDTYSIRYYLLTLVFIIFDVETVFLFPWAVINDQLGWFGLIEVFIFILILIFGYIYAWKAEALEFRREIG
ncbi:MAG: NADH-quinone oxidoreductase subunit A [Spirochaetes bacterium]|nr:NADH-quinone oxidoreductase subunit A [Spirochaetota bacterium]